MVARAPDRIEDGDRAENKTHRRQKGGSHESGRSRRWMVCREGWEALWGKPFASPKARDGLPRPTTSDLHHDQRVPAASMQARIPTDPSIPGEQSAWRAHSSSGGGGKEEACRLPVHPLQLRSKRHALMLPPLGSTPRSSNSQASHPSQSAKLWRRRTPLKDALARCIHHSDRSGYHRVLSRSPPRSPGQRWGILCCSPHDVLPAAGVGGGGPCAWRRTRAAANLRCVSRDLAKEPDTPICDLRSTGAVWVGLVAVGGFRRCTSSHALWCKGWGAIGEACRSRSQKYGGQHL
jgi:hypothetical protein